MTNKQLAQLRLSNGSEVVCEILEWPDNDENQIIARNCMTIIGYEYDDGQKGYAFRPFVNFLDENEMDMILINSDHVVCLNKPTEYLIDQWQMSVGEMLAQARLRNHDYQKKQSESLHQLAQAIAQISNATDEEIDEAEEFIDNVIQFPSRDGDDTIH